LQGRVIKRSSHNCLHMQPCSNIELVQHCCSHATLPLLCSTSAHPLCTCTAQLRRKYIKASPVHPLHQGSLITVVELQRPQGCCMCLTLALAEAKHDEGIKAARHCCCHEAAYIGRRCLRMVVVVVVVLVVRQWPHNTPQQACKTGATGSERPVCEQCVRMCAYVRVKYGKQSARVGRSSMSTRRACMDVTPCHLCGLPHGLLLHLPPLHVYECHHPAPPELTRLLGTSHP
jgi:hypothetical protein